MASTKSRLLGTVILLTGLFLLFQTRLAAQAIPDPESFFGFKPGSDRQLFDYEKLISYSQKLDEASPKVKVLNLLLVVCITMEKVYKKIIKTRVS